MVLGFAFYVAKLDHDLGVSVNSEINRRFVAAGAQVQVWDGGNPLGQALSERDRALLGRV